MTGFEEYRQRLIQAPPGYNPADAFSVAFWAGFDGNHAKRGACGTYHRAAWLAGQHCARNYKAETEKLR